MYTFQGDNGILISDIVAGKNDADALTPVDAESCAQNVNGSAAFIPFDGRLGLQRAQSRKAIETVSFNDETSSFN